MRAGALCWLLTPLAFLVEIVVATAWPRAYSFTHNTISDLGSTGCGPIIQFGGREVWVCSPWHPLMNATFVVVGLLTVAGALLTRRWWPPGRTIRAALTGVALAGVGGVLVGIAPQDENLPVHAAGALLQLPGVLAPLLLSAPLRLRHRALGGFSLACGVVGAVATGLLVGQQFIGLGPGAIERLALWPLTIWTAVVGAVVLAGPPENRRGRRG